MKNNIASKKSYRVNSLNDLNLYCKQLYSFLPIGFCDLDREGIILNTNKTFRKLIGNKNDFSLIGKKIVDFFHEKEKIQEIIIKAKEKNIGKKEFTLVYNNTPVNFFIKKRINEKGECVGFFCGILNIAKFKNLQEELEEKVKEKTRELQLKIKELDNVNKALMNILEDIEEARNQAEEERKKTLAIIENFTDGLMVIDEEKRVILINSRFRNYFRINENELIGCSVEQLKDIPGLRELISFLKEEPKEDFKKEVFPREDLTLMAFFVPLIKDKKKAGTIVIFHDVTREKIIERMKTEFVSVAAHQLRTPLSAIKWTLKMLLDGDLGPLTEEQRSFIEKTYKSNERMIHLVNDLLNVSRIEEGRYLFNTVTAKFAELLESVIDSYRTEAQRKNIEIRIENKTSKDLEVLVDIEKIKLALSNLVENAIKYTKDGGKISIKIEKKDVDKLEFSISDTGVGIPKDEQSRVFTKFYRGSNVLRLETEGSGLGLFITKNIIEAHGGKIWFNSEEGKGSTFWLLLPIKT